MTCFVVISADYVSLVAVSFVFKYLVAELAAMSIKVTLDSAGFTTGPVGPGPRARDPGGPEIMRAKKKKKKRKRKKKEKKQKKRGAKKTELNVDQ